MSAAGPGLRRVVWAFLWLAAFSALYTAGELFGVWPEPAPGAFRDWDLAVGTVAVLALGAALFLRRRSTP
jgi:hypothetical protein